VEVDSGGVLDLDQFKKALSPKTAFISISYANNEIGTIQPISRLSSILKKYRNSHPGHLPIIFHTDASQTPLSLPMTVSTLGVDLMTVDAQKIYGPKGIGFLYKRHSVRLRPLILGGKQEFELRPGTQNTPLIVGMWKSFTIAVNNQRIYREKMEKLRDFFIDKLLSEVPEAELNGEREHRLPNNINISIPGILGEYYVILLDSNGIACSTRSACLGQTGESSYVVRALGKSDILARGSLRFTLGNSVSKDDLLYTVSVLRRLIKETPQVVCEFKL